MYQNAASHTRFGGFRSVQGVLEAHIAMPAAERQARRAWTQQMLKKVRYILLQLPAIESVCLAVQS